MSITPQRGLEVPNEQETLILNALQFIQHSLADPQMASDKPWSTRLGFTPNDPTTSRGLQQGMQIDAILPEILRRAQIEWGVEATTYTTQASKHTLQNTSQEGLFIEDISVWNDTWFPAGRALVVGNTPWQRQLHITPEEVAKRHREWTEHLQALSKKLSGNG